MIIQQVDRNEVATRAVNILEIDDAVVDLFSPEGVCASLRRAASFLCPASPRQLVDAVLDALTPLKPDLARDEVTEALDSLVGVGDLLELRPPGARARLLFLGPPSYVEKQAGHFLLLGIRPNADPIVDEDSLGAAVVCESHSRSVLLDPDGAAKVLDAAGLHRTTREQWTRAPRQEAAATVVEQARQRLGSAASTGQISGLMLIDPTTSVRYYKGRWREPLSTDQGTFIGRRPQAYAAPIWCAVEFVDGEPQAVLDLLVDSSIAPGWDEAYRLQAALDAELGSAQLFRVCGSGRADGTRIFDFFGPLPSWADRYLDLTGLPVPKSRGALFSYCVSGGADSQVRAFLSKSLWMTATEEMQEK